MSKYSLRGKGELPLYTHHWISRRMRLLSMRTKLEFHPNNSNNEMSGDDDENNYKPDEVCSIFTLGGQ